MIFSMLLPAYWKLWSSLVVRDLENSCTFSSFEERERERERGGEGGREGERDRYAGVEEKIASYNALTS